MTVYPTEDYRLAANHNVALVSLVNIQTIKPTGDRYFPAPQAYGFGSPGQLGYRLYESLGFRRGFKRVVWLLHVASRPQYEYLSTNYCGGELSGLVTIYTTVGKSTYARYNATMSLPAPDEAPGSEFYAFRNGLRIVFLHLVAL